jgi:hypothetical protein
MRSRILAMLSDPDRDVRLAAVEAVRRVSPLLSAAELREALTGAEPEVRGRIEGRE